MKLEISNQDEIYTAVVGALKSHLCSHGTIYNNRESIRGASKRVVGAIKTLLHNSRLIGIKRLREEGKIECCPICGSKLIK